jgi:hypothetical protein
VVDLDAFSYEQEGIGKENGNVIVQLLILALLLLIIPTVIGGLFINIDKIGEKMVFRWVSGQFALWAGFQLICVPLILREKRFEYLVQLFLGYMAALTLMALAMEIQRRVKVMRYGRVSLRGLFRGKENRSVVLWMLFWGLLLFQLVQAVRLAYGDTDDAYYVAVSSITESSNTMYEVLPYTGGGTKLDMRHGLAPFPIWVAFLARMSGMPAVMVAQVVLPVVLIAMAYGIFYLLGSVLIPEKGGKLALFLIFTEILVLFGNYSIYTVENFMIARSRQGKAALGSLVIPFLLLLLLLLLRKLEAKGKRHWMLYLLIAAGMLTGCLCSTLGVLLVCLAIGVAGLLGAICYKRFQVLFPLAACCIPCLCYGVLYFLFD